MSSRAQHSAGSFSPVGWIRCWDMVDQQAAVSLSDAGPPAGSAWRSFLAELAAFETEAGPRDALIEAASDTFVAFEQWLAGWAGRSAA